jgi:hypothetical protein
MTEAGMTEEEKRAKHAAYMRGWYQRNTAKFKAGVRATKAKNPDLYRKLNRESARRCRDRIGPSGRAEKLKIEKLRDPIGYLLHHARQRARDKGVLFDLSRDDLVMPERCPVLGIEFEWGSRQMGWRNMRAPSLDRIKPQLGYVRGNVLIISNRANHLKGNGTIRELAAVLEYMKAVGANWDLSEQEPPKTVGF